MEAVPRPGHRCADLRRHGRPTGTAGAGLVPPARVRRRPHLLPRRGHVGGRVPAPPVDRLEYLLVVRAPDGTESMVLDPANPARVAGVSATTRCSSCPATTLAGWAGRHRRVGAARRRGPAVAGLAVRGEVLSPPRSTRTIRSPAWSSTHPEYVRSPGCSTCSTGRRRATRPCAAGAGPRTGRPGPGVRGRPPTPTRSSGRRSRSSATWCPPWARSSGSEPASEPSPSRTRRPRTRGRSPVCCASRGRSSSRGSTPRAPVRQLRERGGGDGGPARRISPLACVTVRLTAGLGEENLNNNRALTDALVALGVDPPSPWAGTGTTRRYGATCWTRRCPGCSPDAGRTHAG